MSTTIYSTSGTVIRVVETAADLREAVIVAVKEGADLRWADLSGADLRWADLSGADLLGANLGEADLRRANLRWANLRGADLSGADLRWANLRGADLSGADLSRADLSRADLLGADLRWANLRGADLSRADLSRADLSEADLRRANLRWANLRWANLRGANLRGADLSRAEGIVPERYNDLLILREQPGAIRAYKLVNADMTGPFNGGIAYVIGETYGVADADTDETVECGAGINVATLPWALREWKPGYRVLVVEFTAADIAAIPHATDGKFRLHRCTVVGEKDVSAFVKETT